MEADGVLYMDIEVVFAIVPVQGRCLGYDKNKLIYRNLQRCTHGLQKLWTSIYTYQKFTE